MACSFRTWAFSSSDCACCLILLAFAKSSSAISIWRFASRLASSAKAFSAMANFSSSLAKSFNLVTSNICSLTTPFSLIGLLLVSKLGLFESFLSPPSHDEPIESFNERAFDEGRSWSSKLCCCALELEGALFCSEVKKTGSVGFGVDKPGNGAMLKLLVLSLDGLVLEAVLDEQAGCSESISGLDCRTLQVSWCSMKLSTLQKRQTSSWNNSKWLYIYIHMQYI